MLLTKKGPDRSYLTRDLERPEAIQQNAIVSNFWFKANIKVHTEALPKRLWIVWIHFKAP